MALVRPEALVWAACPYFRWREFSGWEHAHPAQLARGQQLVRDVLCPARRALGEIIVSPGGWLWSAHGYPRGGVHGTGAAGDWFPTQVPLRTAYEWVRDHTTYGELILESTPPHAHTTLYGFGGEMQALIEQPDGSFSLDTLAPERTTRAGTMLGAGLVLAAAVQLWRMRA